jgi:antirestriction protein ArdC
LIGVERNPNERTRKLAEETLSRLSGELEAGHSEALRNYLTSMGRFHRYSWGNVLLIHSQRPAATQVAGFHTWHQLGRHVKQGEKGIMIFAPMVIKRKEAEPEHNPAKPDQVFRVSGFRTAYVFDAAQTEGKPLPEFAKTTGDPKDFMDRLRAFVISQGIKVEYDPSIAPAQGLSSGGRIRLQPGLAPAEEFSVLTHELAHELLHHAKDTARPPQIVRETQAEAIAFVVCRGIGLETNSAAADYIKLYNGDKKTLAESLAVIQATSAKILDQILPEERSLPGQKQEMTPNREAPIDPERVHSPSEIIGPDR